jgi:hypothetical protein
MAILGTFTQQPNEVLDYDIDFSQWLPEADIVDSVVLTVAPSMPTPPSYAIAPNSERVKVWVYAGGTNGQTYKFTVRATTNDLRVKEAEFRVRIKEV